MPGAGATARRPAVAMNAAGDAVVAWWEAGVMAAGRPAGGGFGAPAALSAAGGAPPRLRAPEVALSGGRTATAAWLRIDGGRARVEGAAGPFDGPWPAAAALSPPTAAQRRPPSLAGAARTAPRWWPGRSPWAGPPPRSGRASWGVA